MWRSFAAWKDLPRTERLTLLIVLVMLPCVSLLLRIFGYVRTRKFLERLSSCHSHRQPSEAELAWADRLARLTDIAGRHGPIRATCLRQALLVYYLLRRKALAPKLLLGVRKREEEFDAHAWVELQGKALAQNEQSQAGLTPLLAR